MISDADSRERTAKTQNSKRPFKSLLYNLGYTISGRNGAGRIARIRISRRDHTRNMRDCSYKLHRAI